MLNHNLLDHLAATVRIYGDPGIEIGVGGAAFAHRWELPRKGGAKILRVTIGQVQTNRKTSN